MKSTKRILLSLCLATLISFISTGCSDKDDPPNNKKITMKFTFTVTGSDANDRISFQLQAGNHDASQYGSPVWKINGVTQGNENSVSIDQQDFAGSTKTYVVETVKPFDFGYLIVDYSNTDPGPFTISYKAEINGKVETNVENLVVNTGQSDIRDLSYKPQ